MSEPRIIPPGQVLPPMDTDPSAPRPSALRNRSAGKRQARDRFAVLNGFIDCTMGGLTRSELAVWLVLYRDTRNGTARTSADDIAGRIGASKRAVLTALSKLQRRKLVTQVYRGGLNRGPSVYRVHAVPP